MNGLGPLPHGVESMSSTVLWIMATLGPRPGPFDGLTPAEARLSAHYRVGMVPDLPTCQRSYRSRRPR